MADSLFHYTDAGAVKSILEKKELWLTDIRFLNDTQELNDGVEYIVDALDEVAIGQSGKESVVLRAVNELEAGFTSYVSQWVDSEPVFVCSFSESANQLSQWRAYGSYAIEFDRDRLSAELSLVGCLYDRGHKINKAMESVGRSVEGLVHDFNQYGENLPIDSLDRLAALIRTASTFKNEHFHEEREVRCSVALQIPSCKQKFRQRGDLLIPYIAESFPFECIKAVHVGPMRDQERAYTAMKAFVSNMMIQYEALANDSHSIKVIQSDIPFRAS